MSIRWGNAGTRISTMTESDVPDSYSRDESSIKQFRGVVETKNREIYKIPMNKKLTMILKNVKSKTLPLAEYVSSEKGKPCGDVKKAWWKALKEAQY